MWVAEIQDIGRDACVLVSTSCREQSLEKLWFRSLAVEPEVGSLISPLGLLDRGQAEGPIEDLHLYFKSCRFSLHFTESSSYHATLLILRLVVQ